LEPQDQGAAVSKPPTSFSPLDKVCRSGSCRTEILTILPSTLLDKVLGRPIS